MERRNYSKEHGIGKKYFRKRRINRENTEQWNAVQNWLEPWPHFFHLLKLPHMNWHVWNLCPNSLGTPCVTSPSLWIKVDVTELLKQSQSLLFSRPSFRRPRSADTELSLFWRWVWLWGSIEDMVGSGTQQWARYIFLTFFFNAGYLWFNFLYPFCRSISSHNFQEPDTRDWTDSLLKWLASRLNLLLEFTYGSVGIFQDWIFSNSHAYKTSSSDFIFLRTKKQQLELLWNKNSFPS